MARPRARSFPAHFDPDGWEEDLTRTTPAGREAAEAARRAYERDGIPVEHLPVGRFGMVFRAIKIDGRLHLAYLAFGVRHPPKDSRRPTVYQLAHQRIHGQPPRPPSVV